MENQKNMAPKKNSSTSPSPSPILIGNCEVTVEPNSFTTCKPHPNTLQISTSKCAKVTITVKEDLDRRNYDDTEQFKVKEGRTSTFGDDYTFVLANSKYSDGYNKHYLEEILKIYTKELPTMNYAANTGKQSMFLERCILNGKYYSLLLISKSAEAFGVVIAAMTYQIVPADMQYAEIPLAAVSSFYQHKGFGLFLYKELSKRLQSVGVRVIYCWGDEESEEFWHKLGFESIAEVDKKGRPCKLPIKADIRRALCFPGGSILMVSHLSKDFSANDSTVNISVQTGGTYETFNADDKVISRLESAQPEAQTREDDKVICRLESAQPEVQTREDTELGIIALDGILPRRDFLARLTLEKGRNEYGFCSNPDCQKPDSFEVVECSKKSTIVGLDKIGADIDAKCSCCTQGKRARAWEASLSSLKSKKVKGCHKIDCDTEHILGLDSGSDIMGSCFNGCSLAISNSDSSMKIIATDPLTCNPIEINAKEGRSIQELEAVVSKGLQSKGANIKVMLMNIADDAKKLHLTKVIQNLGGAVTFNGSTSTHLVTGKVRKTLNFCTGLCSGAWIVSSSWLKESFRRGRFVDEFPHILHDEEYKLKYRSELIDAVLRAKARPNALLKGYDICIATHVQPPAQTLSAIVKSAGGNIVYGLNKVNEASKTIFIACEEDMEQASSAAKKGIPTFSIDWLMNCMMRQELDLQALQFAESL